MRYVSGDTMFLAAALHDIYVPRLLDAMAKVQGARYASLSDKEHNDCRFIKGLCRRFGRGDYRMKDTEMSRLRDVADWARQKSHEVAQIRLKRSGARHEPKPTPQPMYWDEGHAWSPTCLPLGTYADIVRAVHDGRMQQAVS